MYTDKGEFLHATGNLIYQSIKELYPLNRSLTGSGVQKTLDELKKITDGKLELLSLPSGYTVYDWVIPPQWECKNAYIITPDGEKICDFSKNNLHLVGYSTKIDKKMSLDELKPHLHYLEDMPNAIPYVTSYYEKRFGFCLTYEQFCTLKPGEYQVYIDSTHDDKGRLDYAQLLIPGKSKEEILISSYFCHPSMVNNELAGPVIAAYLAKSLLDEGGGSTATASSLSQRP